MKERNYAGVGPINVDALYRDPIDHAAMDAHDRCYDAVIASGGTAFDECDKAFWSIENKRSSNAHFDHTIPGSKLRQRMRQGWDLFVAGPAIALWSRYRKARARLMS